MGGGGGGCSDTGRGRGRGVELFFCSLIPCLQSHIHRVKVAMQAG